MPNKEVEVKVEVKVKAKVEAKAEAKEECMDKEEYMERVKASHQIHGQDQLMKLVQDQAELPQVAQVNGAQNHTHQLQISSTQEVDNNTKLLPKLHRDNLEATSHLSLTDMTLEMMKSKPNTLKMSQLMRRMLKMKIVNLEI
jgi:transcriptional regulator of NAD metabolism